jgi:hypothetical protein
MAKDSPAHIYQILRQAGFSDQGAVTMTAIAGAESEDDPAAIGDRGLVDAVWGPSVGLFQVRTLKAQTGSGTVRDINALAGDELDQARAAYVISKGGTDFSPWTTFRTGAYRKFLNVAKGLGGLASSAASAVTGDPAGTVRNLAVTGLFLVGGLGLVVAGTLVVAKPQLERAQSAAVKAAKVAILK